MKNFIITIFIGIIFMGANIFAGDKVLKTFSGSGGKNTRPFSVSSGWEIQWDAKGDIFQLFLYKADGSMVGLPANQQGSGKGSSYQAKAGKYYLQVNAIGKWNIKIVQVSPTKNVVKSPSKQKNHRSKAIASFTGSGGKNTRPFTVPAGWEIQWDAKGDIFQLFLYNADGSMIGVPANQQGSGKGSSYQAKAGKYYLQVNAMGKWSIKIINVK